MTAAIEQWDLVTLGQENPGNWYVVAQSGRIVADFPQLVPEAREQQARDIRLIVSAPELLAACKAQHHAIDVLMARLIAVDSTFMPTQSGIWPDLLMGNAAMAKAEGLA